MPYSAGAVSYGTTQARQELLDTVARAADELGFAGACLAEAFEQLDEDSGERLEDECYRPVQMAYGRAKRTHAEFAERHGLRPASSESRPTGLASQGAAGFVTRAIDAAAAADRELAGLQDSMLPVEAGDEAFRSGLKAIREPLADLPQRARQFLRGVGR